MGSGSSVNQEFVNDVYRQRLETTLVEEAEKHGLEKDKVQQIVHKLSDKSKEIAAEKPDINTLKGANTFVCAVDGTEAGDIAYRSAKSMLKKKDHVCLFHAYDESKNAAAPVHMRSNSILQKYDTDLVSSYAKTRYSFLWEEKAERDVKDVMKGLISLYQKSSGGKRPDFLVMGYTGSRGITKTEGPTTAGSVSDFAMRSIHVPIILIKDEVTSEPKTFVMAVDDSEVSHVGLDILFSLVRPQDTLVVIHANAVQLDLMGNAKLEKLKEYYEKELKENAPTTNAKFETLSPSDGKGIVELIQEYVAELGPDFFAIAPRANPEKKLTALTENMILNIKTNIILCKE